ncbi:MAG: hypothetical protein AAF865_08930, partial [Pseudomonadota bacterium]
APEIAAPEAASPPPFDPTLPVGWVVTITGASRGTVTTLVSGTTEIGAREETAKVIHDAAAGTFRLAPAGAGLTLGGVPVNGETDLASGATIGIAETKLRFVALCGEEFVWQADSVLEGGSYAPSS